MKFRDKYPDAKYADTVEYSIMKGSKKDNCYICGALTDFIDMDFECPICSEECMDKINEEFFKALRKGPITINGNTT